MLRHVQCPKLKNSAGPSLFHYYKQMCPQVTDNRIIYLYVSPQEVNKEKLADGENDIKYGIVRKDSRTMMHNFVDT